MLSAALSHKMDARYNTHPSASSIEDYIHSHQSPYKKNPNDISPVMRIVDLYLSFSFPGSINLHLHSTVDPNCFSANPVQPSIALSAGTMTHAIRPPFMRLASSSWKISSILFHHLLLPLCYLRWMCPVLPGYLVCRLLPLYCFYCHSRLKFPSIWLPLHLLICTPFLVLFFSMPDFCQARFSILAYCPVFGVHYTTAHASLIITIGSIKKNARTHDKIS